MRTLSFAQLHVQKVRSLPHFVYALIDPRNGQPRYVGMSSNIEKRLASHSGKCVTPTKHWVAELRSIGLMPIAITLCGPFDFKSAVQHEVDCIAALRGVYPLLNARHGTIEAGIAEYRHSDKGKEAARLFKKMRSRLHFDVIHWAMEVGILEGYPCQI